MTTIIIIISAIASFITILNYLHKYLNKLQISYLAKKWGVWFPSQDTISKNISILNEIEQKLKNTKSSNQPPIIIGAIYWDITADQILAEKLEKDEWIITDPIRLTLGGSSVAVGKYLYQNNKQRSYLISAIGKPRTTETNEIQKLIRKEEWIITNENKKHNLIEISNEQTAITLQLIQDRSEFSTMLTHAGALSGLTWDAIRPDLKKIIRGNELIFISGFLKTGLHKNLKDNLENLSKEHLICIDHGRISPKKQGTDSSQLNSLKDTFDTNFVDIYICTFNEILGLHNHKKRRFYRYGKPIFIKDRIKKLRKIAQNTPLPPITFVRGLGKEKCIEAYVIVCGTVYAIDAPNNKTINTTAVKPKSIFTAELIYHLINSNDEINERIKSAGKKALNRCYEDIKITEPSVQYDNKKIDIGNTIEDRTILENKFKHSLTSLSKENIKELMRIISDMNNTR